MLLYCLIYRKKHSKNSRIVKTNKGRLVVSSKCPVCDSNKSRFIKEQEFSGLINSLFGLKSPIAGIPWLGSIT